MFKLSALSKARSANQVILLCSLWLTLLTNFSYYSQVSALYDINIHNIGFVASIPVLQFSLIVMLLSVLSARYLLKLSLLILLIGSAGAAYYMDSFGIVIDQDMIRNVFQTNTSEALDLVTLKFIASWLYSG